MGAFTPENNGLRLRFLFGRPRRTHGAGTGLENRRIPIKYRGFESSFIRKMLEMRFLLNSRFNKKIVVGFKSKIIKVKFISKNSFSVCT